MNRKLLLSIAFFFTFSFFSYSQTVVSDNVPGTGKTWMVPAGVSSITVEIWGAGGAGGGSQNNNRGGGGGGAGGYSSRTISVIAGQIVTYSVGTGGTGSTSNGTAGTGSSFTHTESSTTLSADGGGFGTQANGATTGGAGGAATGGTTNTTGGSGAVGAGNGSSGGNGGNGGSSPNGATGGAGQANNNGTAGLSPGAGGGGGEYGTGTTIRSGGNGGNGQIRVTYTQTVTYKSQIVSIDAGSSAWCPGEVRNVNVTIKNIGTATWTDGTSGSPIIRVGVKWNGYADYYSRVTANNLAPNATQTYTLPIQASNNAGAGYTSNLASGAIDLKFDVVYEAVSWFAWNLNGVGPGNVEGVSTQTILAAPANQAVTAAAATVCSGTGTNINLASSEIGVSYQLRNASNVAIGSAVAGTGAAISLPTGNLTANTTFNVLATSCGNSVQMTATPTVAVSTLATTSVGTYTFCIDNTNSQTSASAAAGQYALVNVVKGFTYTFSVTNVFSSFTEYLTILDASNDAVITSNSGGSGTNITNWVSTLSGQIKVVLSAGANCANNGTAGGTMSLNLVGVNNTLDNQLASGTDSWIGHVYNINTYPPTTNASNAALINAPTATSLYGYVGYVNMAETIPAPPSAYNFGGNTVCFPTLSNGVNSANIYTEGFAVRYRMRSTKAGCYMVTVSGDDGVRLYVDGVKVFDAYTDHSTQTFGNVLVYLSGSSDLVLDYYENGTVNELSFNMVPFDNTTNTVTPTSKMLCTNTTQLLDGSSYPYNGGTNSTISFKWQRSSDNVGFSDVGVTTEDYTPPALTPTSNITYYYRRVLSAVASNATACVYYSNSVPITTSPAGTLPTPGTITGITTQCPSVTGQVYSVPAVTNAVIYNWVFPTGWTITAGAGTNSVTVTTGSTGQGGNITVNAQNGCSTSGNQTLAVTVNPVANNIVTYTNGTSSRLCVETAEGGTASFTAPSGTYFNTVSFASYGTPTGSACAYTVNSGCHASSSQSVVETALLGKSGTLTIAATNGVFVDPCSGTTKRLYVTAYYSQPICSGTLPGTISGTVPTGGTTYTYLWESSIAGATTGFAAAAGTNNGQNYTPPVALTQDTWYRRTVNSGSCAANVSAVVLVKVNPLPTISGTLNVCVGSTTQLTGSATAAATNPWVSASTGVATINSSGLVSGASAGTSVITYTNTNGCSITATVTVYAAASVPQLDKIVHPTCIVSTGSIFLKGLPSSGQLLLTGPSGPPTTTITGSTMTISGLTPGDYTFAVNVPGCGTTAYTGTLTVRAANRWDGTNWSFGVDPTINDAIIFDGNYSLNKDVSGCSCTVSSTANVTIQKGKTMTITNAVTVNTGGSLTFLDDASLVQTAAVITNNNAGDISYNRETTINRYDWTYWSSPVIRTNPGPFTLYDLSPGTLADKYNTYDSANDKWTYYLNGTQEMLPAVGYTVRGPQSFSITVASLFPATFIGVPNNGLYTFTPVSTKWNLIGNPYPSAIDADAFININHAAPQPADVGALYFWTHTTPLGVKAPGANPSYTVNDYAVYTLMGGTGTTGSTLPNGTIDASSKPLGKIAAGQSFFMLASTGNTISFTNAMRVAGNNTQFYKTSKEKDIEKNRLWLNFTNTDGAFKQALIGYMEGATNSWDVNYDANTMDSNSYVDFYSINDAEKLTIQARALPFDESDLIPLGYKTAIAGDFTIAIDHADGFFDSQVVYLEDKLTGKVQDLTAGDYTFTTEIGTFTDRFTLSYTKRTLGTGEFDNLENTVLVSVKDKAIKVNSTKETINEVTIYDISGKLLYNKKKVGSNELQVANFHSSNQVLLVKVGLENGYNTTRKIIFQ